jgi:dTDP-4-dehydrorhamnose 3,5-epimerase-like enzyme
MLRAVAPQPALPRLIGPVVSLWPLADVVEERGDLLPIDLDTLPFPPRRLFVVRGAPPGTVRGGHAHRRGEQLLVRLSGSIRVEVRRGSESDSVDLGDSGTGLLVPPGVWSSQTYLTADAALLVLCSHPYDPADYEPRPGGEAAGHPEA